MTCNDVEPNYRIGKRFKSLTSKNLIKYLILTSYKPNMRFYRITSIVQKSLVSTKNISIVL